MKALFLADLYQLKINCKSYLLFVFVATVVAVGGGASGGSNVGMFMSIYAVIMCSMMGMSLLQLDEQSRWNITAQALPCTRRDQVSSKYAVTLASFGVVWVLFTAVFAVLALLDYMAWGQVLLQTVLLLVIGLVAPAVSLPALFRWGSAKGRVIYIAMIMVVAGGLGALMSLSGESLSLPCLPHLPTALLAVLAVAVPAALFALSWALAVRWYEKREL